VRGREEDASREVGGPEKGVNDYVGTLSHKKAAVGGSGKDLGKP